MKRYLRFRHESACFHLLSWYIYSILLLYVNKGDDEKNMASKA